MTKKLFYIVSACMLLSFWCTKINAEVPANGYFPESMRWRTVNFGYDDGCLNYYVDFTLQGDTLINGKTYHNLSGWPLLEVGQKIYLR